jgi:hypothetical protein
MPRIGHGSSFSKYGCMGVVFLLQRGKGSMEINIEAILEFAIASFLNCFVGQMTWLGSMAA